MTTFKLNQAPYKTLDTLLNSFFNETAAPATNGFNFPAVNISENKDAYELEFNVPGRNKEDFKITVDKDILTVSFEKKEENKEEGKQFIKREFVTQSFKRSFSLNEKINAEDINAAYENGLLLLTLPKKEEVKIMPKEITIR